MLGPLRQLAPADIGRVASSPSSTAAVQAEQDKLDSLTRDALVDAVVTPSEAEQLGRQFDRVLATAEQHGDARVYRGTLDLLRHVATLGPINIGDEAGATLRALWHRHSEHRFGTGALEPGDVLSPRPAGRRARLMATISPKSPNVAKFETFMRAGLDVARLNFAHGELQEHRATIAALRTAASNVGREIRILLDLPGPKIRLGTFRNPGGADFNDIELLASSSVVLTTEDVPGDAKLLPVNYPYLALDVKPGQAIYLNDGKLRLRADRVSMDPNTGVGRIEATVELGGILWDRKGINLPDSTLSIPTVTPDDLLALGALVNDVDLIGISFVRCAEDVLFVRDKMKRLGRVLPIIAKIERPEGLVNLAAIAGVADALMVARGDLRVEIGAENVPAAERRIHRAADRAGIPSIQATGVLESMKTSSRPTQGEVEGLYAAVAEHGADCIMLAGEVSGGQYPDLALETAAKIIETAETD